MPSRFPYVAKGGSTRFGGRNKTIEMSRKMWVTLRDGGVTRGWRAEENHTENELKIGYVRMVQVAVMTFPL